jgi:hypothetical protein
MENGTTAKPIQRETIFFVWLIAFRVSIGAQQVDWRRKKRQSNCCGANRDLLIGRGNDPVYAHNKRDRLLINKLVAGNVLLSILSVLS